VSFAKRERMNAVKRTLKIRETVDARFLKSPKRKSGGEKKSKKAITVCKNVACLLSSLSGKV